MFYINPNPTFSIKAKIPDVTRDSVQEITLVVRHKTKEQIKELVGKADVSDFDLINEIVCGWEGVFGADGQPVEFSENELRQLDSNYHGAALAIFLTYREELQQGRVKN